MDNPIGLFDSGVGGLTVVKEMKQLLPCESVIYLGDNARNPYGSKSKGAIKDICLQNAQYLVANGVKIIVVACNTASAVALNYVRERVSVPVLGVIEGSVLAALKATRNGRIGIIGTRQTIASDAHAVLIKKAAPWCKVFCKATPLFAPLVEEDYVNRQSTSSLIEEELVYFKNVGVDTLILGCTHYPLLKRHINNFLPSVQLVDSSRETALNVMRVLRDMDMLNKSDSFYYRVVVTDKPMTFIKISERFLGCSIFAVEQVTVDELSCFEKVLS